MGSWQVLSQSLIRRSDRRKVLGVRMVPVMMRLIGYRWLGRRELIGIVEMRNRNVKRLRKRREMRFVGCSERRTKGIDDVSKLARIRPRMSVMLIETSLRRSPLDKPSLQREM
jgi:hypothetical protein